MSPSEVPTCEDLHDAATHYAEMGFRVFPLCPQWKTPATQHGCKDATDDLDQIDAWWTQGKAYNIGIATDGLLMLDVDIMKDGSTNPFVASLNGQADDLDAAPCVMTRSGGFHWWFRQPEGIELRNSDGRVAPRVDTRGDGGYAVAPPSYVVARPEDGDSKPSGAYRWLPDREIEKPSSLPTPPAWLVEKATKPAKVQPAKAATGGSIEDGSRNSTLFHMASRLRSGGFTQTAIDAAIQAENVTTCNPPLPADEVARIAESVMRYEADDVPEDATDAVEFQRITCRELAAGDYQIDFLIDNMLVAGQPLIIAGPQKSLKTSFILDAAISMSVADRMLGRMNVARAVRVLVMTGESGLATIQETARRIAVSKGHRLEDLDNLLFSPDVPRFGNVAHADALRDLLTGDEIEVLFIDPAYLCMPGADAGNLMVQGELLRSMAKTCTDVGVTLVVAHHTKKNTITAKDEPLELTDIAWAGFAEFARQWWLVNRRERYEEGTGEHRLWLSVGGSAGHSALWAVNVSEGVYSPTEPRWWDVGVESGSHLLNVERQEKRDEKANERERKAEEQRGQDRTKVWGAMQKLAKPESKSTIAAAAGLSYARGLAALLALVEAGMAREAEYGAGNSQKYGGFELTEEGQDGTQEAA